MNSESRILELCHRAIMARDTEAEWVLAELRAALREHMKHTRRTLSAYPFARVEWTSLLEIGD